MAITRQDVGDLNTWSLAGGSVIGTTKNVNVALENDVDEGRGIAYVGKSPNTVKQSYKITTGQMSAISSATRVANLDISAFTVDGTDYLTHLRGGNISISYEQDEAGGVANLWKSPLNTVLGISGSITLNLPNSTTANALRTILKAINDSATARNVPVSITINAIAVTLDMHIMSYEWNGDPGKLQTVTFQVEGKDDGSGIVTAPAGTTTLLEKALNAFKTPIAFAFTPKAANSLALSGECIFTGASFTFNDAQIITTEYSLESHGTVTATQN